MVAGEMPKRRSAVAVDREDGARGRVLQVARHVGELGQLLEAREQARRPVVQLVEVGVGERVLVLRAGEATADVDVLAGLHQERRALHLREPGPEARDDLVGGELAAFVLGPQSDEEDAAVELRGVSEHGDAGHVRILAHDVGELDHAPVHAPRTRCPARPGASRR